MAKGKNEWKKKMENRIMKNSSWPKTEDWIDQYRSVTKVIQKQPVPVDHSLGRQEAISSSGENCKITVMYYR
jgi:predicted alpha/beta hydrolase family esterase